MELEEIKLIKYIVAHHAQTIWINNKEKALAIFFDEYFPSKKQ
jgi:hypothetical protein